MAAAVKLAEGAAMHVILAMTGDAREAEFRRTTYRLDAAIDADMRARQRDWRRPVMDAGL